MIKKGYVVFVVPKEGYAHDFGILGEVQEVTQEGFRVTTFDWVLGMFTSWDMCFWFNNINELDIATPNHNISEFIKWAAQRQEIVKKRTYNE